MLVADPEQFAVFFARPEPQLDLSDEPVRVERQRVLDVALRPESGRNSRDQAVHAGPARVALAPGLRHAAHARPVLRAPVADHLQAQIFRLRAPGRAVSRQPGIGQVVELKISGRAKRVSPDDVFCNFFKSFISRPARSAPRAEFSSVFRETGGGEGEGTGRKL